MFIIFKIDILQQNNLMDGFFYDRERNVGKKVYNISFLNGTVVDEVKYKDMKPEFLEFIFI